MNLLFDIGGTKMRFALTDDKKTLQNTLIFHSIPNYETAIEFIKSNKDKITQGNKIESISGGIASVVQDNLLIHAQNLENWDNKPLAEDLMEIFGSQNIVIKNDAALGALAEAQLGAGKSFNIVGYITIGTGIGGARVVNNFLDEAFYGFEPGHQIINFDNSKFITFEELASGSGIKSQTGNHPSEIKDQLFWINIEKNISYGLNNITLMWSPEVIVLGGGIVNSNLVNIDNIKTNLSNIIKVFPKIPEVRKSELGEEVGLYGAILNL